MTSITQMPDLQNRIRGGVYGLLIGDALGVPYEFHDASEIPESHLIEMTPPTDFQRAHTGVPEGTWSDDGAQALMLLESLNKDAALNLNDFAESLVRWYRQGYMTPDGRVFDVGIQTHYAIEALEQGEPPESAGPSNERANGNGSLMRVLPVVFFARNHAEVIDLAMKQSVVTHGHIRSQLCAALYGLTAYGVVHSALSAESALDSAIELLTERVGEGPHAGELATVLAGRHAELRGSGYVVDSLWSALSCVCSTQDYETCVRKAIALGKDTDTTACIAGGLAGLMYGEEAIPQRWKTALKGQTLVESLLESLLKSGKS